MGADDVTIQSKKKSESQVSLFVDASLVLLLVSSPCLSHYVGVRHLVWMQPEPRRGRRLQRAGGAAHSGTFELAPTGFKRGVSSSGECIYCRVCLPCRWAVDRLVAPKEELHAVAEEGKHLGIVSCSCGESCSWSVFSSFLLVHPGSSQSLSSSSHACFSPSPTPESFSLLFLCYIGTAEVPLISLP